MFSEADAAFMALALKQAEEAFAQGEVPVGAVIAAGDRAIAVARNTRERDADPTAHAEINCLRLAAKALKSRRLDGHTLYVTLEPCPMCAGAITQSGISRVVFGAYDPRQGCAGSVYRITEDPALGVYIPADGGLMRSECAEILTRFFKTQARKPQESI